jgi:ubiquitin-protein ligase
MLSPRIRRLKLDYDQMAQKFAGWPLIQITGTAGMPPEVYRFAYNIKGLFVASNGEIQERAQHHLEVNLSLGYPRRAPQCRMLTPVFHPNFDDSTVCIGDFWAASEGLDDLIIRIGRMIAYQEYNTKSPLNGLAAKWAEQHAQFFPVDARDIAPPLEKVAPAGETSPVAAASIEETVRNATIAESITPAAASDAARTADANPAADPEPWTERISIE